MKVPKNWLFMETCRDIKGNLLYVIPVAGKRTVPSKLALDRGVAGFDTYRVISSKVVQEGLVSLVDTVVESYSVGEIGYDDGD